MRISRADALKLAAAVEKVFPELAEQLRMHASRYHVVIVTVS